MSNKNRSIDDEMIFLLLGLRGFLLNTTTNSYLLKIQGNQSYLSFI